MSPYEHGTSARYTLDRCRCAPCVEANSEYDRAYREDVRAGRPRMVPARPVIEHLELLARAGVAGSHSATPRLRAIAGASGVAYATVYRLLRGEPGKGTAPPKVVKRRTAEAILALSPEEFSGVAVPLPAGRTKEQIGCMVSFGLTRSRISRALGSEKTNLHIASGRTVQPETAERVEGLHSLIWRNYPPFRRHCRCELPTALLDEAEAS